MVRILQLAKIKNAVSALGKQYGIERAWLFGSYARGEATSASDVDVRIDTGENMSLFAFSGLHLDLQDHLGKKVDLLATDSLDKKFLDRISGEEVLLYANR